MAASLVVGRAPGDLGTERAPAPAPWPRLQAAMVASYLFLLPVQVALGPERRLAVSDIFVIGYLVVSGFRLRRLTGAWTIWFPALLAVLGMGLLVSLVTMQTVSEYALVQKSVGLVLLLVTFACLVDFFVDTARIRWALQMFLAGVLVNVLIAIAAFVVQQVSTDALPSINYVGTRLSGLLIDPNAFGGLVACALMLHLFTTGSSVSPIPGRWGVVVTLVLAIALVLTFSRSAWIATALGIGVAVVVGGRQALGAVVPLGIGVIVAVPVLAALFLPNLVNLASRPDQVAGRFAIIEESMAQYETSPVVGIGLGAFPEKYGFIIHNSFFWFLAEMGIIGLTVFVGFVVSFALRMLRLRSYARRDVAALALAALSAHASMVGLSLGIEALYQRQWWFVLAIGSALYTFKELRE